MRSPGFYKILPTDSKELLEAIHWGFCRAEGNHILTETKTQQLLSTRQLLHLVMTIPIETGNSSIFALMST
jgi:hypothetical protein